MRLTRQSFLDAAATMRAAGVHGPYICFAPRSARSLAESCGLAYMGDEAPDAGDFAFSAPLIPRAEHPINIERAEHIDRDVARALLTPLAEPSPRPDARHARVAAITARKRC